MYSGYPVDHAHSSHSALYNSYHGDGRIASLILIDYSTTQYTYYAIKRYIFLSSIFQNISTLGYPLRLFLCTKAA